MKLNNSENRFNFKSTAAIPLQNQLQNPAGQNMPDVQLPDIYYNNLNYKEPVGLKDGIKKADMMGMLSPYFEAPVISGITAIAAIKGLDAYTKACGGEYEKSILGKATKLGDNIAQSKFMQKKGPKSVSNFFKKSSEKVAKLLGKSDLLKSMVETPALPEWQTPKYELIPQNVRNLEDFNRIMDTIVGEKSKGFFIFKKPIDYIPRKQLGLDKQEIEAIKKAFNVTNISKIKPEELSSWTLLKRLGTMSDNEIMTIAKSSNSTQVAKEKVLEFMKLSADDIADIKLHPEKWVDKVKEVSMRVGNKVRIGAGRYNLLGPFQIFERKLSLDQVGNKLHSISGGAKTKLGAFFAKALQKIHRGFTFGGGKLGMMLMIVPGIVMAFINAKKADKDEKVGTVANGLINSISWVVTFPLSIAATYALGGMQYAGMGKENVQKYRDLINQFNAKTFTDHAAYKEARKVLKGQLKNLRKSNKNQSLFTKMMKGISKFFYQDLGMIKPFQNKNAIGNLVRKVPNFMRNVAFVPLRFILSMFVIESFVHKIIDKGSRTIFGKHYNEEKAAEYESKKQEQKAFLKEDLTARLYEAQKEKLYGPQKAAQADFQSYIEKAPLTDNNIETQETIKPEKPIEENIKKQETINTVVVEEPLAEEQTENIEQSNTQQNLVTEENQEEIIPEGNNLVNTPEEIKAGELVMPGAIATAPIAEKIFDKKEEAQNMENKYIPSSKPVEEKRETSKIDNYTYIPSSENVIKEEKNEIKTKKYIPSQIGAKFTKTFDNSKLDAALRRADLAEKKALQTLAGKFGTV